MAWIEIWPPCIQMLCLGVRVNDQGKFHVRRVPVKNNFLAIFGVAMLSGCSLFPVNWGKEEGYVWCNARYLDLTSPSYQRLGTINPNQDKRFKLAYDGYIYALLGAVELQKEGKSEDKHFFLPKYIEIDSSVDEPSGFQASAFKVYEDDDKKILTEVVVAFRGTDQFWKDYSGHNLHPSPKQYKPAQSFVLKIANKYKGKKLVVTGYSLGGGLAMNVLQNEKTSPKISQAWAFNSSPRSGERIVVDPRLYLLSAKGEILDPARKILREGPKSLGAMDEHFSDGYDLVNASSAYLHSRWVLARQMLIFADMVYYEQSGRNKDYISPPLEILKMANQPKGCDGKYKDFLIDKQRL